MEIALTATSTAGSRPVSNLGTHHSSVFATNKLYLQLTSLVLRGQHRPRLLSLGEAIVREQEVLENGISPAVGEALGGLVGNQDYVALLLSRAVLHVEDVPQRGAALDNRRSARLAQALEAVEEGAEVVLVGGGYVAEEASEDGSVLNCLGSSLGEVREGGVAGVAEEDELSGGVDPRVHLNRVLRQQKVSLLSSHARGCHIPGAST